MAETKASVSNSFYANDGGEVSGLEISAQPIMWIGHNPPHCHSIIDEQNATIVNLRSALRNGRYTRGIEKKPLLIGTQKLRIHNLLGSVIAPASDDVSCDTIIEYLVSGKFLENCRNIKESALGCSMIICGWGVGKIKTQSNSRSILRKTGRQILKELDSVSVNRDEGWIRGLLLKAIEKDRQKDERIPAHPNGLGNHHFLHIFQEGKWKPEAASAIDTEMPSG